MSAAMAVDVMQWVAICDLERLERERGVCALVDGEQVAIFRTFDDELYAVANRDPFSGAYVLSRGIVGTRAGEPTVASPMFKQVFNLKTGRSYDDETVSVATFAVRVVDGQIQVNLAGE